MAASGLYGALEDSFETHAEQVALEIESRQRATYRELQAEVARCANALRDFGLRRGDRVVSQIEKSPQALVLYLACLCSGCVYVPLNTAYRQNELSHFVSDAEPSLLICNPSAEGEIGGLLRALRSSARLATLDASGGGSLAEAVRQSSRQFATVSADPDQLAAIIYTSGTTGRSKGAMLTHRNLLSNAMVLIKTWGFSSRDVLLHALPIFHVHGLFVATHCALLSGAKLLWRAKFDASASLVDLARATVMMGVPTHYTRLLAEAGLTPSACAGLRLFVSGSAPLLPDAFRAFQKRTGHAILERYGMSETGMITSNPLDGERRAGTVGRPLLGVSVRVTDAQDHGMPIGETGGIQVRGDNVFAGYWRDPVKTREEFTGDGWFRTGDMGVFDGDGYLSIVGRAKDLIITGGYNVYPKEVEAILDAIPGVAESAVVGLPHADFGEAVTAAVVLASGGQSSTEAAIIAHLKTQLANYKVPKRVYFVADLPRNAMGKVEKNVLRQKLAEQAAQSRNQRAS
jgi:malonyl-CoA/methylmalonyl-CoA synthetase